ncbi:6112_t:CDS:1, partial [Funneliformis caledonium]
TIFVSVCGYGIRSIQRKQSYTLKSSDIQCKVIPIYLCLFLAVQRSVVKEADSQ